MADGAHSPQWWPQCWERVGGMGCGGGSWAEDESLHCKGAGLDCERFRKKREGALD